MRALPLRGTTLSVRHLLQTTLACTAACTAFAAVAARPAPTSEAVTSEPGSAAASRVVSMIERIEARLSHTRYQAVTRVDWEAGDFRWDCSGMVGFILRRAAPRAFESLDRRRPVAADFHRVIAHAPAPGRRAGWRRVPHVRDARPGDVAAWRTPRRFGATGHVVIFLDTPRRSLLVPRRWVVRVADSTTLPHWADSRRSPDGGYGTGVMSFEADDSGAVHAWGWLGPAALHLPGHVAIGRPL